MGLSENQKNLIKEVSNGDMRKIKQASIACLIEDKTQKNKYFCERYLNQLKNEPTLLELPHNIKTFAIAEDVSLFNENRYLLSERDSVIVDDIKRMVLVGERMKELGISHLNATLLHGDSGTGKTTLGRYIAKQLDVPFIYLNFSTLIESYMGNTSKNIARVFDFVNANKCVFMLDEIDCISIERGSAGSGGSDGELSRITISLMQEFDKLGNDIVVLSATNRKDRIDKALLRRFSKIHEVKPLTSEELENLREKYVNDIGIEVNNVEMNVKNQSELIKNINQAIAKEIEKDMK